MTIAHQVSASLSNGANEEDPDFEFERLRDVVSTVASACPTVRGAQSHLLLLSSAAGPAPRPASCAPAAAARSALEQAPLLRPGAGTYFYGSGEAPRPGEEAEEQDEAKLLAALATPRSPPAGAPRCAAPRQTHSHVGEPPNPQSGAFLLCPHAFGPSPPRKPCTLPLQRLGAPPRSVIRLPRAPVLRLRFQWKSPRARSRRPPQCAPPPSSLRGGRSA